MDVITKISELNDLSNSIIGEAREIASLVGFDYQKLEKESESKYPANREERLSQGENDDLIFIDCLLYKLWLAYEEDVEGLMNTDDARVHQFYDAYDRVYAGSPDLQPIQERI